MSKAAEPSRTTFVQRPHHLFLKEAFHGWSEAELSTLMESMNGFVRALDVIIHLRGGDTITLLDVKRSDLSDAAFQPV